MMTHFWMGTIGIVLYMTSMWAAGVTQGLMWRAFNGDGTLKYPEFIETVIKLEPFYWIRIFGGLLYLSGLLLMVYNFIKSLAASKAAGADLSDPTYKAAPLSADTHVRADHPNPTHHLLEGKPLVFTVLVLVSVVIGGICELIPLAAIQTNIPSIASVKPYSILELEGRDIYIREGCYVCHSQMVRPFKDEVIRYGAASQSGEFVYDHPFQFGSKRTGPDLHRVGGKYSHFWHFRHMKEPTSTTPGSIMPRYPWLYDNDLNTAHTKKKVSAMRTVGVPYTDADEQGALEALSAQANQVTNELYQQGVSQTPGLEKKEIIALIAYLQRLGTDIKKEG